MVLARRPNPAFEQPDTAAATHTDAPAEQTAKVDEKPAPTSPTSAPGQAPSSTAVSTLRAPGAVATRVTPAEINTIKNLKDAYHVDWATLMRIQAAQGAFIVAETQHNLGAEMLIALLSFQDQWVATPNVDKAPKDLVKFSDDGITATDGTDMKAHLEYLKSTGYPTAKISQRYVVVFAIENAEKKGDEYAGQLAQMDLAPMSKAQFDRYQVQSAYDISKGKYTADQVKLVDLSALVTKNASNQPYTLVKFGTHKPDAAN